ncbi:MAG: hypothetical protein ABI234_11840 [Ktedonobacteraceae bacterium]
MKKFHLRSFSKRFATLGVMAVMAVGALVPATVFAAPASPTKCAAGDTACVIAVGDKLISERQTALTKLNTAISTDLTAKKINSDQASALQSNVTTNQTGLTNLKTKLDAETSAKAARADVANIFSQLRIFAVVLPRDYRHLQLNIEQNVKALMQSVAPGIQDAIAKAPAAKQAQLKELFKDYQQQVAAAESQVDIAQNDFPAMTPENFNLNRATYEQTRKAVVDSVKDARTDLHKAADDLKKMTNILGV